MELSQTFWAKQYYKEILNTNKFHSHSTSGIKGNCDSLYEVWTFYYICRVAQTNRPCGVGVGAYTYTIPQFVGSFKLDSVPLREGSILDLGATAQITTGGPQPVTYTTIYAITHFNTLNPCPLITVSPIIYLRDLWMD
jgi:hypothetical protein